MRLRLAPLFLLALAACTTAPVAPRTVALEVDRTLPPPRIETRRGDNYEYREPQAVPGAPRLFAELHGQRAHMGSQLEHALYAKAPPEAFRPYRGEGEPRIRARFVAAVLAGSAEDNAELGLVLRVRAHLVSGDDADSTVLGEALYEGRKRRVSDWLANDALPLREELAAGIDRLATDLTERLRER